MLGYRVNLERRSLDVLGRALFTVHEGVLLVRVTRARIPHCRVIRLQRRRCIRWDLLLVMICRHLGVRAETDWTLVHVATGKQSLRRWCLLANFRVLGLVWRLFNLAQRLEGVFARGILQFFKARVRWIDTDRATVLLQRLLAVLDVFQCGSAHGLTVVFLSEHA